MTYPVVRLDLMSGTINPAKLRTGIYHEADATKGLNNGTVVQFDSIMTGEYEYQVWKVTPPTDAGVPKAKLGLVATPELGYDEREDMLADFQNPAGMESRIYLFEEGDSFSVTTNGFAVAEGVTVAAGCVVEITAGSPIMSIVATATEGSTQIGEVIALENDGEYDYFVIQVM